MTFKETKKDRRIRDKNRMKAKSIRVAKMQSHLLRFDNTEDGNTYRLGQIKRAVKHCNHIAICSCAMCGNPRKWFGRRTLSEIKHISANKEYS
jgi:hypothetical protein